MKKILTILSLCLVLLLVVSCGQKSVPQEKPREMPTQEPEVLAEEPEAAVMDLQVVEVNADGFNPSSVTITAGETVTWVNRHSVHSWPASAMHPTHRMYPGSDINKCQSTERSLIFDACQRLEQGESYSFMFYEKGTWRYHDHLNPTHSGTVVVE